MVCMVWLYAAQAPSSVPTPKSWAKCAHIFKFKHILSHTAQYKHSFFFVRIVPEWNSLAEACINADTVTAFQAQLRHTPWAVCTPPIVEIRESGLTITELELELGLRELNDIQGLLYQLGWIDRWMFTSGSDVCAQTFTLFYMCGMYKTK